MKVLTGSDLISVGQAPDTYFTQGYGLAAAAGGMWILLTDFDGSWQMPLIVQDLGDGVRDASSPYGYAGVFASPRLTSHDATSAWKSALEVLADLDVISIFLRHSPLVPQAERQPGQSTVIESHPTIVTDIHDLDTMWAKMEGRCRTAIRKAERLGLTATIQPATHELVCAGSDFRRLYARTMTRRDAAEQYQFDDEYFERLQQGLGADLLVAEVMDGSCVVSSALLMKHRDRLHYHLSGSTINGSSAGANNLLLWASMKYAHTELLASFHLGGGIGAGDSLRKFKRSFGGREVEYSASGVVVDRQGYDFQTRMRATELQVPLQRVSSTTYFPSYRGGV